MTLKEAIKVLSDHNKWRRGSEKVRQHESKDIGEAIDIAVHLLKQMAKDSKKSVK